MSGSAIAQTVTPEAVANVMRTLGGPVKARPSGAKGQCFVGTFTPTAEAKTLTKSVAFEKGIEGRGTVLGRQRQSEGHG